MQRSFKQGGWGEGIHRARQRNRTSKPPSMLLLEIGEAYVAPLDGIFSWVKFIVFYKQQ